MKVVRKFDNAISANICKGVLKTASRLSSSERTSSGPPAPSTPTLYPWK